MAISAPPGKGRGRESVRACVRERGRGRDGVRSRGGRGRGRGSARVCGSEREAESATGSPRLSGQRGVARHGQKVSSAPRASEVAGSRRAMPGWEGTEPPSRERFQEISVWRWRFPRLQSQRGRGAVGRGRQAARNSPLATAAGRRGAPACALLPPHRPTAPPPTRGSRPEAAAAPSGTRRALRPVLQHRGQRRAPSAPRTAPRPLRAAGAPGPRPRLLRPAPENGGPRTGLVGTPPFAPGLGARQGEHRCSAGRAKDMALVQSAALLGSRALAASSTALAISG